MAKKESKVAFTVEQEATQAMLVSRNHRTQWGFHAFVGDLFASEDEAKEAISRLIKMKAIPNAKYNIRRN